jgi:ADP-L-glycero-D-manno-heptose 6-epimerase
VLLTGGLGFIASSVLDSLLKTSDSIVYLVDDRAIDRKLNSTLIKNLSNSRVIWIPIDEIISPRLILDVEFDSLIHLGAIASTSGEIKLGNLLINNAYFSELLFSFAAQRNIYTVYASSAAVYGITQSPMEYGYLSPSNVYGLTKAMTENAAQRHSTLRAIGLRLFNVYGEGEFHKKSMVSLPLNLFLEAKESSTLTVYKELNLDELTEISRDYISVESVRDLILKLITLKPNPGIIDVGSGQSLSTMSLVSMVKKFFPDSKVVEKSFFGDWSTYQKYTRANLDWIEKYKIDWVPESPEIGILKYLNSLALGSE